MTARFFLAALPLAGFGATIAQAQPVEFACPRQGTITQSGVYKTQYLGASSADPYICNRLDAWGKPTARLFNFYRLQDSSNAAVRAAFVELLSGRTKGVSFDYTSPSKYFFHETWTFLRREPLLVDGRAINTLVFDHESIQTTGAALHGRYKQWLDPASGLWLKGEFTYISGQLVPGTESWTITSITFP